MSVFLNFAAIGGEGACAACGAEMREGQEIYTLVYEKYPWLPEYHDDQRWPAVRWHKSCDQGSLSAACAEDQTRHPYRSGTEAIGCVKDDSGMACDCSDVRECGSAYPARSDGE